MDPKTLHFHLLSDFELGELHDLLRAIRQQREEVTSCWYAKYLEHFGDTRSLSEPEFFRLFDRSIEEGYGDLLEGGMAAFRDSTAHLGAQLAERGVTVEETIATLELFEECVRMKFHRQLSESPRMRAGFYKLGRASIVLLMSAYFRSDAATAMERIAAAQRDGARQSPGIRTWFRGMVGASDGMRDLYRQIEEADEENGSFLVAGESGTGKGMIARAIHTGGPRRQGPFIAFSCSGIPEELAETELFGDGPCGDDKEGCLGAVRAAAGGTLFLDEVTALSSEIQRSLLRVIQRTAEGSDGEQPADVRVIASTRRVPEEALAEGRLRSDLYFRLRASTLKVPPLRERRGDLLLLARHFIELFNARLDRSVAGIDERAMAAMVEYSWPGNVRELSSAIEAAFNGGRKHLVELADLPQAIGHGQRNGALPADRSAHLPVVSFAEMERELIRRALETTGNNKLRAAGLLRISRKKLYAKIRQHGL